MQKRLTRRNPDGAANFADAEFESVCAELTPDNRGKVRAIVDKLAAYEDAEEQERLLTCPIKRRQTVYIIMNLSNGIEPWIEETTVDTFEYGSGRVPLDGWRFSPETAPPFYECDIGKTVFLTREEAEAALKGGA